MLPEMTTRAFMTCKLLFTSPDPNIKCIFVLYLLAITGSRYRKIEKKERVYIQDILNILRPNFFFLFYAQFDGLGLGRVDFGHMQSPKMIDYFLDLKLDHLR